MKAIKFLAVAILLIGSVQVANAQNNRSNRNDRMRDNEANLRVTEKTTIQPCMRYDDEEYFAGSGFTRVKAGGDGERDYTIEITKLLNSVRQQVKQKIGGKYQAVVRDYFDQMDVDSKSSDASHIESAGEQIIDQYLNDTEEDCRTFGEIDESGYQKIYVGILVKKSDLVNSIVNGIEENSNVPADVKQQVRANENAFRESAFKVFNIGDENK